MVLKWTNRGKAHAAVKPAPAPTPVNTTFVAPAAAATYDGKPMKAATDTFKSYGKHVFTGNLADYYLKKNGGSLAMMEDPSWVSDRSKADIIAKAVLEW